MILFVESPLTGSGLTALNWAYQHGLDPALVTTDPAKYRSVVGGEVLDRLAERGRLLVVPTTEGETLPPELVAVAEVAGPVGVVCLTDRHLLFAAVLAQRVGAPFASPEAVRVLRDKRRARVLYAELGLTSPRWTEPRTAADAAAFVRGTGRPAVLKNCRGTGSLDVVLCRTPEQAEAAFAAMSAAERYLDGEIMAEEYVTGPLYSLETLVVDGTCRHLGLTDRQLGPNPAFCEVSYTFPVQVSPLAEARMRESVEAVVKAAGIPQGMLHTEFVVSEDDAHVVEVNARMGGGLLALMMDDCLTTGMPELLCTAAAGGRVPEAAPNGRHSSTVTVYAAAAGRLARLGGLREAADSPYVVQVVPGAAVGDEVRPAGDYRGAVCQIRTAASSPNLAFNAALAAARDLDVDVDVDVDVATG